jgi:site-specific recombinase XerD
MKDMVNMFIAYKTAQGLAPRTISDYKMHLSKLEKLLDNESNYRLASLIYLSGNINNTTYNFRFRALKVFFDFCLEENMMEAPHPLKGLKRKKGVNRIVNIENDVIERLLSLPDKKTYAGLRNYTCLLYSLDNGTRPSESLSLKISDFNLSELLVTIPANIAKTRISRTLPITIQTANSIRKLIHARHPDWDNEVPLFCSQDGSPLSENSWGHIMHKYSEILGVSITPYSLRHCCCLSNLKNGMNIFALKNLLGHTDISTTQIYLSGLSVDDLRKEHQKFNLIDQVAPVRNRQRSI